MHVSDPSDCKKAVRDTLLSSEQLCSPVAALCRQSAAILHELDRPISERPVAATEHMLQMDELDRLLRQVRFMPSMSLSDSHAKCRLYMLLQKSFMARDEGVCVLGHAVIADLVHCLEQSLPDPVELHARALNGASH